MYQQYETAVAAVAATKRKPNDLIICDAWWREEYVNIVKARSDMHISREELSEVMKWKLLRGVHRPALQNLIMQNSSEEVVETSRKVKPPRL